MPDIPDSPLAELVRVRHLLMDPTADHLQATVPLLNHAIGKMTQGQIDPAVARLSRQIGQLHRQAGTIRWGAARLSLADSAGYTPRGEASASPSPPHLAITG